MKYSLEEIKEAMRKEFIWSEDCMGVEIIKKSEDGDWFEEMFESFKKKLKP